MLARRNHRMKKTTDINIEKAMASSKQLNDEDKRFAKIIMLQEKRTVEAKHIQNTRVTSKQ